jgi:tetratricopeptide (TPR) repeat protein
LLNLARMKKNIIILFVVGLISLNSMMAQQVPLINFKQLENTHDILLSPWGPYSKKYAGISHIADQSSGLRFDVSVMPGYYRNKVLIPNVLFESGYFPWQVDKDMRRITYRYELEWKDRVFVDATYQVLDSSSVLIRMNCVNNTSIPQNLALNTMAYLDYPEVYPSVSIELPENCKWYNGISYQELTFATPRPTDHLVADGLMRGEARSNDYIGGSALAKDFGRNKNDLVVYTLPVSKNQLSGKLCFRYRVSENTTALFKASGLLNETLTFKGSGKFELLTIPYSVEKEGTIKLTLESMGGSAIELNGLYIGPDNDVSTVRILPVVKKFKPDLQVNTPNRSMILKYADVSSCYGIAWNFSPFMVREVLNDELDIFFRKNVHNHVSTVLQGNGLGHYTNVFMRPVELAPNSSKDVYALICYGTTQLVKQRLETFTQTREIQSEIKTSADHNADSILPEGKPYVFSNKMMQATMLSNIVYPIYTQQQYIRHFTPGKWWNSLYTWDSGFEALGLSEIDINKAIQCVNAYTTPVGSQSAFIHHGSMVPVQIYVFYDLWNKTQSTDLLAYFYPRLKQYYAFMAGEGNGSTTRPLSSNLLKTWNYFYNSGGWDDYPPQKAVQDKQLASSVTPVITTAQCIRVAKMLRQAADALGLKQDVRQYDADIKIFTQALQTNSWDQASGYFSYVKHNEKGEPIGFFLDSASGKNYNMGLDGAYPLSSGICTPEQQEILLNRIFATDRMWTPSGIGVVDQSAPYYRIDGYWNGSVWMPHQWFMWKAMLDIGRYDLAYKIAKTALDVWKNENDESYYTFEHFFSKSGRGAGWHQFSGLSSPVLAWFSAYFKPGTVTVGFETWIQHQSFSSENSGYRAELSFDQATKSHPRSMIVCLNPSYTYEVYFNGAKIQNIVIPYKGLLQITLPASNSKGTLIVKPMSDSK